MNTEQTIDGTRLRECRRDKQMTLRALAEKTGLSVGFLSKIENGIGNPSAANIQKICYSLGITVNDLMTPKEPSELMSTIHANDSYVLRKNERCLLYNYGGTMCFEAIYEGNPHFKLNVLTLSKNQRERCTSQHSYDEFGIVTKGVMNILLNDTEEYHLEEGDCILIRAQTKHTILPITNGQDCVSIWVEISEQRNAQHPGNGSPAATLP